VASGATPGRSRRAVIFLGPPGAGKGTQAKVVASRLGVPHLSTGDMFRDHVGRGTELGRRAKPLMERGELVADEIVLGMVTERIGREDCARGFVFDGFPRTLAQAEQLEAILRERGFWPPVVLHVAVGYDELFRRLSGRRTCKVGGEIYNVFDRPPKVEGRCDKDGGELVQRPDDREEVVRDRLATYERQTAPLVEHYRGCGALMEIDGAQEIEAVTRAVLDAIERAG
jgi:adenylate kinase